MHTGRDDSIVAGVDENWLIQRERDIVRVESLISRRVESGQRRLSKARDELLNKTDALGSDSRAPRTVVIPELDI